MPFKPNYRFERFERERLKKAKKEKKLRRHQEERTPPPRGEHAAATDENAPTEGRGVRAPDLPPE